MKLFSIRQRILNELNNKIHSLVYNVTLMRLKFYHLYVIYNIIFKKLKHLHCKK